MRRLLENCSTIAECEICASILGTFLPSESCCFPVLARCAKAVTEESAFGNKFLHKILRKWFTKRLKYDIINTEFHRS